MKKIVCLMMALVLMLTLVACGKKTVTCDGCGEEIKVKGNSNITDEWIVYCKTCKTELFGEDGLISAD
jgi:uncharacterized lipoprotein YehR (DUF1307 family)